MRLSDNSGVKCDRCSTSYQHDFTYYSFDFSEFNVISNRKPSLQDCLDGKVLLSVDICSSCYGHISSAIIGINSRIISHTRRTRVETVCEISGTILVGTYLCYFANVARVDVSSIGQNKMTVSALPRAIEFMVSEPIFSRFKSDSININNQSISSWSTVSK